MPPSILPTFLSPSLRPQFPRIRLHPSTSPLSRPSRPSRPAPRLCLGEPPVPPIISSLDLREFHHRQSHVPAPPLDDAVIAALHAKHPSLRALDAALDRPLPASLAPTDHRVYTWLYNNLRTTRPSWLVTLLVPPLLAHVVYRVARRFHARNALAFAQTLLRYDAHVFRLFALFLPLCLLAWALWLRKPRENAPPPAATDAIRRTLVLHMLSLPLYMCSWALAATFNPHMALLASLYARGMTAASLWLWADLRREIFLCTARIAPFFRTWRLAFSIAALFIPAVIRVVALTGRVPVLVHVLQQRAVHVRVVLGKRFPVALSICNDPRALFLAASIVLSVSLVYLLYLAIYPTDFLQTCYHRDIATPLTDFFVARGIYQPNVHPNDVLNRLSAPNPQNTYLPSPAMMLRHDESLRASALLASEPIMPVLDYLDKEDELLRKEGIDQWLKPRFEQVPLSDTLTADKRSADALLNWAKEMSKDEQDLSFAEFFETLEDDEYRYDSQSGNWVFENAGTLTDVTEQNLTAHRDRGPNEQPGQQPGSPGNELQVIVRHAENGDAHLHYSPELEPWLERYLSDESLLDVDDDARDDDEGEEEQEEDSNTVFV